MASDQLSRSENPTTEREIYIEKDKVPKMTTHFESLAEKVRSDPSDSAGGKETRPFESAKQKSGNTVAHAFGVGDQKGRERQELDSVAPAEGGAVKVSAVTVARTEKENQKPKGQELNPAKAKSEGIAGEKGSAEALKGSENQLHGMKRECPHAIGKFEVSAEEEKSKSKDESRREKESSPEVTGKDSGEEKDKGAKLVGREKGGEKPGKLSLDEISMLRATAQQNATETIRSAESRYNKAKESASQGLSSVAEYAKDQGDAVLQGTQNVAVQAKDTILDGAKKTSQYVSEKGSETKDTAAEKIQHGYATTKDTLVSAGKTALDYTVPKAEQAKDYAVQQAVKAKDTAVDVSKNIASFAGEKAVATKDVTVETGKEAAEYAAKMAAVAKDKAVAAGWSATHYTTEKTVEGTKAAVRAVDKVAEYAGHKVMEIAAKPLGAAAAAAGESMIEHTARKKEEAERELEAKKSAEAQDSEKSGQDVQTISRAKPWSEDEENSHGGQKKKQTEGVAKTFDTTTEKTSESDKPPVEKEKRQTEGVAKTIDSTTEKTSESDRPPAPVVEKEAMGTGVLGAIGETIVEIAQNTKELIVGPDETHNESGGYGEYDDAHSGFQHRWK